MNREVSDTRPALNEHIPEPCDCSEIDNLARAYDNLVATGLYTQQEALGGFIKDVDADCSGKIENPSPIRGCGSPEKVCGHCKTASFLIRRTLELRSLT